jgi:hypothetical protein
MYAEQKSPVLVLSHRRHGAQRSMLAHTGAACIRNTR